jgi:hypothetical protein
MERRGYQRDTRKNPNGFVSYQFPKSHIKLPFAPREITEEEREIFRQRAMARGLGKNPDASLEGFDVTDDFETL